MLLPCQGAAGRGLKPNPAVGVSATLLGIIFLAHPNFAFANDSLQITTGYSSRARTLVYETGRIPMSRLNLILTGTVTGTRGLALIRVAGRKAELFTVGQMIASGVFLTDVYRREVVITHDGVLEKLEMRSRAVIQDVTHIESNPAAEQSQPPPKILSRDQRNFVDKLFEVPDVLARASIIPVPAGGIQISDIAPGSWYEQLGLSDGDTIRTINGAPVNSISDFVNIFQQRHKTDKLQLGVARNGNLYKLQFDPEHGIETVMKSESVQQQ